MSTSPYRGLFGLGYTNSTSYGDIGARQLVTRKTSPIRAISTTSSNIVSIPAFGAAHRAVRPRSQALSDRRLADLRLRHRALDQRVQSGLRLRRIPSLAPRHSADIDADSEATRHSTHRTRSSSSGFTLVLSGRNDWVATTRTINRLGASAEPRRQQVQRPCRPDLQFRLRPCALRLLRHQLQSDHRPQRVEPAVPAGDRPADRDRLEIPA